MSKESAPEIAVQVTACVFRKSTYTLTAKVTCAKTLFDLPNVLSRKGFPTPEAYLEQHVRGLMEKYLRLADSVVANGLKSETPVQRALPQTSPSAT